MFIPKNIGDNLPGKKNGALPEIKIEKTTIKTYHRVTSEEESRDRSYAPGYNPSRAPKRKPIRGENSYRARLTP
jgi:hypothetical protein